MRLVHVGHETTDVEGAWLEGQMSDTGCSYIKRGFHPAQRMQRRQRNRRNATDVADATTASL